MRRFLTAPSLLSKVLAWTHRQLLASGGGSSEARKEETNIDTYRLWKEAQGLSHMKVLRNATVRIRRKVRLDSTSCS